MAASSKESKKRWRDANPNYMREYMREWRARNGEAVRAYKMEWRAANPGRVATSNIAYKRAVAQQTPRWADMDAINAIYLRAQDLAMTVDHVVPLRGAKVSGLHVQNNLRCIPHAENASKSNKFEVA